MKLSIIVTTRNRKKDLIECVNSIINSNFLTFDWELIIIDDNSNDGTEKIKLNDLGIKNGIIFHNDSQQMMVKSRNIGISVTKGQYLLFIDDDNIIDNNMIKELIYVAENNKEYGIIGPSMFYLKHNKKYLDYQKINFFTGKTIGKIDKSEKLTCESDGIPNVFLIKRETFEKCGIFDESLIQTFTEPDFAFTVKKNGYKCCIVKNAKTYHNVENNFSERSLGGEFKQKAYCLMRNRSVIIARYGNFFHKIVYIILFSWFWPLLYSLIIIRKRRIDLIKLYWLGFKDGIIYFINGNLKNSLLKYDKKNFN